MVYTFISFSFHLIVVKHVLYFHYYLCYCYTGTSLIHLFKTSKLLIRNYLNIIYLLTDPYLVSSFLQFCPVRGMLSVHQKEDIVKAI